MTKKHSLQDDPPQLPTSIPIPPFDSALIASAQATQDDVRKMTVTSLEGSTFAQGFLRGLKERLELIEQQRRKITDPLYQAKKATDELFARAKVPIEYSITHVTRLIVAYGDKVKAAAEEAQRIEDERAAKEQARLQKLADAATARGDDKKATAFLDRADAVQPAIIEPELPRGGKGIANLPWTFEINDPTKVLIMCPDVEKIRKLVRSLGMDAQKVVGEGVTIKREKTVRSW